MGTINSLNSDKGTRLTIVGLILMVIITLTKVVPTTTVAGSSIFVGIIFFFIIESAEKTSKTESGLRFKTLVEDMKKPWVLPLVLLTTVTGIATLVIGDFIFKGGFSAHVIGRTESMLSFNQIIILVIQIVIAALGEEMAWRGFFLGKAMKLFPFWICAILSSSLFAVGHLSAGSFGLVFYDVSTIFIDSLIYAILYKKTSNCLVSTVSHILCNMTGVIAVLIFI